MLRSVPSRSRHLRRNVIYRRLNIVASRRVFISTARPAISSKFPGQSRNLRSLLHTRSESKNEFLDDTIYALSTAPGRAGIAIIRISGSACLDIYQSLCPSKSIPRPRYAAVRTLYEPANSIPNILDSDALVLYFPAPNTVTGEDVLELHVHGGSATVKAVLSTISQCTSAAKIRYAEPGEFTRRAFQNDRLDLAQVEALSDTLSAETEQQRRAAVRGNSGKLGQALIDFSEDQHFDESPAELLSNVTAQVETMLELIAAHESASHRGELLKKGIRIALLGPPNAGKSSLLNQIVGREASIVSQEAGTTRDIVEVGLDIRGYLCTFADTAGLRTQASQIGSGNNDSIIGDIEREGIRRAKSKANESDLIVALASIEWSDIRNGWEIRYDQETFEIAARASKFMIVINKSDSVTPEILSELINDFKESQKGKFDQYPVPLMSISCKDAQGLTNKGSIGHFVDEMVSVFSNMTSLPTELVDLLGVTERQRQLLTACSAHLLDFMNEAQEHVDHDQEADIVLAAEHLRSAANCLSRITGRGEAGDVEEVLGVVFEKFCVGK
ncbi:GTP-binding protein [Botrytis cinerea]